MSVMVRSQTAAKRATCAAALGYDRCFYDAPELFGEEYRVKMLKTLLQDKDLGVRRSAIQSCQSVFAPESKSLLPMLEKMKNQQGLNAAEKQHLIYTLELLKKLK
jgi:oligoendopeptidase F